MSDPPEVPDERWAATRRRLRATGALVALALVIGVSVAAVRT
jgi:hypothetical protein